MQPAAAGIFLCGLTVLWSAPTLAQSFDTNKYCRQVADAVGGSNVIELACRQQEEAAQADVRTIPTSQRTMNYCIDIARTVGGSYVILKSCIEQENRAGKQLGR